MLKRIWVNTDNKTATAAVDKVLAGKAITVEFNTVNNVRSTITTADITNYEGSALMEAGALFITEA